MTLNMVTGGNSLLKGNRHHRRKSLGSRMGTSVREPQGKREDLRAFVEREKEGAPMAGTSLMQVPEVGGR